VSDVTPPAPETFVDDDRRYRLDSRIATGGMGEVWRATDTQLGRTVAIKLLKNEYADDTTFRSRFVTEARHAASLHHPGVASVYDFGEASPTDGSGMPRPFLVMELVEGQPLSNLLREGRALDPEAVRDLLAQAGDAIGAAHRAGIVHRDVKPANLMVTPDRQIKITDFGIARASDGLGLTGTGQVMGTPQYLSPEQARGQTATPASDVYSLGVVGFECLAGRRPFDAESPVATALAHLNDPVPDLPATIPTDLAVVVRRALAKNPQDRYADGTAFAEALRHPAALLGETELVAMPPAAETTQVLSGAVPPLVPLPVDPTPTPAEPLEPAYVGGHVEPRRRSPWLIVLLLAALALLAGGVTWALTSTNGDQSQDPGSPDTTQTVTLNPDDYVGRDIDVVTRELEGLGLEVRRDEKANPGERKPGVVTALAPTGEVHEGDTITVSFWGDPNSQPSETASQQPSASEEPSDSSSPTSGGPDASTSAPPTHQPSSSGPTQQPSSSAPPTSAPPSSSAPPPSPTASASQVSTSPSPSGGTSPSAAIGGRP
jgi:serine/threonine-protein kinase